MTRDRRRLPTLLAGACAFALLALFAWHVDWHAALAAARAADPLLLLLGAVLSLFSLVLKGVRWWVFLRPLGVRSPWLVLRATFAGASLNNLLVAQGGEGARVLMVSRATGISSARVLAALALERVLDMTCYLALLVGAAWWVPLPTALLRWRGEATASLALVAVLAAWLLARAEGNAARQSPVRAAGGRAHAWLHRFAEGVGEIVSPARVSAGVALSLGAWALQVATYHCVAMAAHLPLPVAGSVAALLAVGVSFLIRATPGNVGLFQVIYALAVRSFGVDEGPAVAAAVLIQMVQVIPTLVLGTVLAPLRRESGPRQGAAELDARHLGAQEDVRSKH